MDNRTDVRRRGGFTQVELIAGLAIMAVLFVMAAQVFVTSSRGLVQTRVATNAQAAATNFLNEVMTLDFFSLGLTTQTETVPDVTPEVLYDPVNFPPQSMTIDGVTYTRYVYTKKVGVDAAGDLTSDEAAFSGEIDPYYTRSYFAAQVHATVLWKWSGGLSRVEDAKIVRMRDLSGFKSAPPAYVYRGIVRSTEGVPIAGAGISAGAVLGWTDATGTFEFAYSGSLLDNSYVWLRAPGYQDRSMSFNGVASVVGNVATADFIMQRESATSGNARLSGTVWIRDRLVIGEVAGEVTDPSTGVAQEYIELLNLSYKTLISTNVLLYFGARDPANPDHNRIIFTTATASLSYQRHYLIGSRSYIKPPVGANVTTDAYYTLTSTSMIASFPDFASRNSIIPVNTGGTWAPGCLMLYYNHGTADAPDIRLHDVVGWAGTGGVAPPAYEGSPIPETTPLGIGQSYSRFSSTAGVNSLWAPSYDSDDNANNFSLGAISPTRSSMGKAIYSGRPGDGTIVKLSNYMTTAQRVANNGLPYAFYSFYLNAQTYYWSESYVVPVVSTPAIACDDISISKTLIAGENTYNIVPYCGGWRSKGVLRGKITDPNGHPMENVRFNNHTPGSGADGSYYIPMVAAYTSVVGELRFSVRPPSDLYDYQSVVLSTSVTNHVQDVVLTPRVLLRIQRIDDSPAPLDVQFNNNSILPFYQQAIPVNQESNWTGTLTTYSYEDRDLIPNFMESYSIDPLRFTVTPTPAQAFTVITKDVHVSYRFATLRGMARDGGTPMKGGAIVVASREALAADAPPPVPTRANGIASAAVDLEGRYELRIRPGAYYLYAYLTRMEDGTPVVERREANITVVGKETVTTDFDF